MSAKKGAPALYELYHSGKTPRRGLFGKGKPTESKVGDVKSIPMAKPQVVPKQKVNVGKAFAAPVVTIGRGENLSTESAAGRSIFEILPASVTVTLPMWLFALVALVLVASFVAAFSLGRNLGSGTPDPAPVATQNTSEISGSTDPVNLVSPTPGASPEMQAAADSQAVHGLISGAVNTPDRVSTTTQSTVSDGAVSVAPSTRPARCLIVCGNSSMPGLDVVRDFFIANGLAVELAKRGNEFVLVTSQGFTSSREDIYGVLKNKIGSIGEKYVAERPDGGLNYTLGTFRSCYPIDTNKLEFNIK